MVDSLIMYEIKNCKVSEEMIFNGNVLNINNEPITESIKRTLKVDSLLCEKTNEGFEYDEIEDLMFMPLSSITLGTYLWIMENIKSYT